MDVLKALHEVRDNATELQRLAKDMATSCETAEESQEQGISLLNAKTATLLRYNVNLAKLALARVRGEPISTLAEKLVEDGVVISKLRPIEKKLQHHIDHLLTGALHSAPDDLADEQALLRPNPSAVMLDGEDDGAAPRKDGENDVYRPPRLAEVVYDATDARKRERREAEKERFQARAMRSEGVREMMAEVKGLPEEVHTGLQTSGSKSARAVAKSIREDKERKRYEEDNFVRLSVTKKDRKRRRDVGRAAETGGFDGSDDFFGLSKMADHVMGRKQKRSKSNTRRGSLGVDDDNGVDEEYKMSKLEEALANDD